MSREEQPKAAIDSSEAAVEVTRGPGIQEGQDTRNNRKRQCQWLADRRVGTAVDSELAAMWAYVDVRSRRLSPADRAAVRNAIASGVLEGAVPALASIDLLVEFADGDMGASRGVV